MPVGKHRLGNIYPHFVPDAWSVTEVGNITLITHSLMKAFGRGDRAEMVLHRPGNSAAMVFHQA